MEPEAKTNRPKIGLVLSGGGARGAYEVGVIRYIRERLAKPARFDVIVGSSVGAINGSYIAATCDRPRGQGRMLSRVWSELTLDDMYRFGWPQMRTLPQVLFGKNLPKVSHGSTIGGLVDSSFIADIVHHRIPWRGITDNLEKGHFEALSCSATELATGITTSFIQTRTGELPRAWPGEHGRMAVPTTISAAHTLASAAIPVIFPAVRIGDQFFVDGSLRQNTPIRPAMRLGADRLLVISLRHAAEIPHYTSKRRERASLIYPNAVFMAGKLFNALMLDKLEAELERVQRTNQLLEAGERAFGPDFAERIAVAMDGDTTRPYQKIKTMLIRPSQDLGRVAHDVIQKTKLQAYSGVAARWFRRVFLAQVELESDLGSYILFDPAYIKMLVDLGFHDAATHHQELLEFFDV